MLWSIYLLSHLFNDEDNVYTDLNHYNSHTVESVESEIEAISNTKTFANNPSINVENNVNSKINSNLNETELIKDKLRFSKIIARIKSDNKTIEKSDTENIDSGSDKVYANSDKTASDLLLSIKFNNFYDYYRNKFIELCPNSDVYVKPADKKDDILNRLSNNTDLTDDENISSAYLSSSSTEYDKLVRQIRSGSVVTIHSPKSVDRNDSLTEFKAESKDNIMDSNIINEHTESPEIANSPEPLIEIVTKRVE